MFKIVERTLELLARRSTFFAIYLHYLRGREGGGRRHNIDNLVHSKPSKSDTLIAIWDFSVWPYALGDILNWNICMCCNAVNEGKKHIDIYVIVDNYRPSPKVQSYITPHNYERFLLDIFPAFHTNPMLNTIKIFKDRNEFEREMVTLSTQQAVCYPTMSEYAEALHLNNLPNRKASYSGEFKTMNNFFKQHNYVPTLKSFKGIETIGTGLQFGFPHDVFFVCLHLRQRRAEQGSVDSSASLYRDAEFDQWIDFIKQVGKQYSNVRFLLIGRHEEVDRRIFGLDNVIFLKHHGHTLAGELSAIVEADLFMGSNSGPAMMAMLSEVPYRIFQTQKGQEYTAKICDIKIGSPTIQFARQNQKIIWGHHDTSTIFSHFENAYKTITVTDSEKETKLNDSA